MKKSFGHKPRKRFGQNFLCDESIIARICQSIQIVRTDNVVEIGPGRGALTKKLLPTVEKLHVIELDRDLITPLKMQCDGLGEIIIYQADALHFDYKKLAERKKIRIVGNLPYNISTPLLFYLINYIENIEDMYFMLQLEVVERMVAKQNTAAYGRLSVMAQYFCQVEKLFTVPPNAFYPQPKVFSAFVRLIPHRQPLHIANDYQLFADIVRSAFSLRRKTLRNSLANFINAVELENLGIHSTWRAENLSLSHFVEIANYLSKKAE